MSLELIYIIIASLFALTTLVGLPGTAVIGLIIFIYALQTGFQTLTVAAAVIALLVGIVGSLLDNVATIFGAKKFGASKYGIIGAIMGMLAFIWLGPLGIVVGPFLGALLAEMYFSKKSAEESVRPALGSVLGMFAGLIMKIILAFAMVIWFALAIF